MSNDGSTSSSTPEHSAAISNTPDSQANSQPWQAIFSSQYNAYYFYNTETQQTTWENPLQPSVPAAAPPDGTPKEDPAPSDEGAALDPANNSVASQYAALQAAAIAAGIDPSLAHLDPTLLSALPSSSAAAPLAAGAGVPPSFTAKFNARTGQFTRPDGRDPTHLSEHARMTRMSEFYFDVKAWEAELAQRGGSLMGTGEEEGAEGGRKRKRPTKKDLVCFFFFLVSGSGDSVRVVI